MKRIVNAVIAVVVLAGIAGAADLNGNVRAVFSQVSGNNGAAFAPKSLPLTDVEQSLSPEQVAAEIAKRKALISELWRQRDALRRRMIDRNTEAWREGRPIPSSEDITAQCEALASMRSELEHEIDVLEATHGNLPSIGQVQQMKAQIDSMTAQKAAYEKDMAVLIQTYAALSDAEKSQVLDKMLELNSKIKALDAKIAYAQMFK